ncbi:hypothetical protein ACTNEO_08420 [Gracilibacillus sp. HCP3S3_G5_1]|uniref:hypothetical protein n=1 Tax=unclassified Gracilibacillus TaxID=2625209 RepID=UPI003F8C7C5B
MKLQQLTYLFILLTGFSIGIYQAFDHHLTLILMVLMVTITIILIVKDIISGSKTNKD